MSYQEELPVAVYTPTSQIRSPSILWRSMRSDLVAAQELAWRLFVRDLSAQYRQSVLGVLWAFAPPLITGLIFIFLQASKVVDLGETDVPYPLYVLTGTVLWQTFVEALNAPLKSVHNALPMLNKINFPREALILSGFYSVLFSLLVKLIILVGIFLLFKVHVTVELLLAPLAILVLILFGVTIGLLLTPMGVLYTDISAALPVVTQVLFFVTPVVYSPPQSFPFSLITTLNPVSPLLIGIRGLITKGVLENPVPFSVVAVLTVPAFFTGWIVYRVAMPIIIERTGT